MAETEESRNLENEIESLKADLGKLRQDLRGITDSAAHLGRDSARVAKDAVRDNMQCGMNYVEDCMREKPVSTALIAFSAGIVIAKLFGRRR